MINKTQNKSGKVPNNLFSAFIKLKQINVNLLLDHYFIFLSVKTEINENGLNFINLDGSNALQTHIPAT